MIKFARAFSNLGANIGLPSVKDGIRYEILQPKHNSQAIEQAANRHEPMAEALGIDDPKE